MTRTPLTDELLKRIVEGSGRVYTHEAKSMAEEILERRRQAQKAVSAQTGSATVGGPWGAGPMP